MHEVTPIEDTASFIAYEFIYLEECAMLIKHRKHLE